MPRCDFCHQDKPFVTTIYSSNPGRKKACEDCIQEHGGILNLLNKANNPEPKSSCPRGKCNA